MATTKNITMKQFNGTDYDTLYPKTIASQVDGVYTQQQILTDSTKTMFGLGPDAVPDDAFKKTINLLPKIGDIKVTARTDLGEDWLLCNGAYITRSAYEKLSSVFPFSLSEEWTSVDVWLNSITNSLHGIWDVAYANNTWVVCGNYYNGTYTVPRIAYSESLNGPWLLKDFTEYQMNDNSVKASRIIYAKGYWVASLITGSYYARVAYATSLNGNWSVRDVWNSNSADCDVRCLDYVNGYFVLSGRSYTYTSQIAYAANPGDAWTVKSPLGTSGSGYPGIIEFITYEDGKWICGGTFTSSGQYSARIAYSDTLDGTWTKVDITKSGYNANFMQTASCFKYVNGNFIIGGRFYVSGKDYAQLGIAYSSSLNGPWTVNAFEEATRNKPLRTFRKILYVNDTFVLGCSGVIFYSNSLDGTWYRKYLGNFNESSDAINDIEYENGIFVVGGNYVASSQNSTGRIYYLDTSVLKLPTISVDKSFAYIKAK